MNSMRKWSRTIHRDLSFLFSGIITVYALSGIYLNHKRDFNSNYSVKRQSYQAEGSFPAQKEKFTETEVLRLLAAVNEESNYTKHYFPDDDHLKIFIKGGSSIVLNITDGQAVYEALKKRPIISRLNRLHYNPNRWWTVFSDTFAVSLLLIVISGLVMNKGKRGLRGRGGIEFIAGILIPLLFIFFS